MSEEPDHLIYANRIFIVCFKNGILDKSLEKGVL